MNDVPNNAVVVTTTILIGGITFTTTLLVQTNKMPEVDAALELAWQKTKKAALNNAPEA